MKARNRARYVIIIGVLAAAIAAGAGEETSEARALLDKLRELNRTTRKWNDASQLLTVTIFTKRGAQKHQELEVLTKKYGDDVTRTVVTFRAPPEIRGMGVLQWVEAHKPNQTWLYLPEVKRVRRITGTSQRDSFAGTDFSYEDLSIRTEIAEWTAEEASAALRTNEACEGHNCAVIEVVPKTVDVGYRKIRLWLDRDEMLVRKFEFEEANDRVTKTLLLSDVRLLGNVPTAHRLEMRNERSGSRTVAVLNQVAYDNGLKDALFTQHHLEQGS
jgi:hypothetical protein